MRWLPVVTILLLSGCIDAFCNVDRLEAHGAAPGLHAKLDAPIDLFPDAPAASPGYGLARQPIGDAWIDYAVTSGRPNVVQPERPFALWLGTGAEGALLVWGSTVIEVQVYAENPDALVNELRTLAPDQEWPLASASRQARHSFYFHDFSIDAPLPNPWVFTMPLGSLDLSGAGDGSATDRHVGWWIWGLASDRTLRGAPNATLTWSLVVFASDDITGQISGHASEQRLRERLVGDINALGAKLELERTRYIEGSCSIMPPET